VSDAGCGSGTLRLRQKIPLLFGEKSLKTVSFDSLILKQASLAWVTSPEDAVGGKAVA
jgi:hypothetical protein